MHRQDDDAERLTIIQEIGSVGAMLMKMSIGGPHCFASAGED